KPADVPARARGLGARAAVRQTIRQDGLAARRRCIDRIGAPSSRLYGVEVAAVARHDAVELGQRLDLVDDYAPHLGRAFGGLLRQLQDALAPLGSRAVELLLPLGRQLLHSLRNVGTP